MVRTLIADAPRLIPIQGHRMMPDEPHLPGNPVFSILQPNDVIYYGANPTDYFYNEYRLPGREPWPTDLRSIRFWSAFVGS